MRFLLLIALLGPLAGLSWLLEAEDGTPVMAVSHEAERCVPPATLGAPRSTRPRPVAPVASCVSISGHVISAEGLPVAGARVRCLDDDEVVCDRTTTDVRGAFQLHHAYWDGTLEVDAGTRGRAQTWLDEEDRRDLRIGLLAGADLHGRVLEPDGVTPVEDARVVAYEDDFGQVVTRAGGDGRFVASPVPTTREFELCVDGGARGRVRLADVRWAEAGSLDVVLEPVRTLCGRVVARDDRGGLVGVKNVEVRALEGLRGKPDGPSVRTDEEGRFRCHVYGWKGHVQVISKVWCQVRGPEVFRGSKEVVVEVRPRATLRGRCELADGTPVAGAVVTCSDPVALDQVLSDATGRFEIPRVGSLYTQGLGIAARSGGLVGRRYLTKLPEPGYEPVVVLEPTAAVRGRVLDERGMPCAYVWAKVRYVPDPLDAPDRVEREYEITDAEGRFLVVELPVGPCELEIEASGFTRKTLDVSATLSGTDVGDIRLMRMPVQTGQLVDSRGSVICGGTYCVDDGASRPTPVRTDGTFELGLPADLESEVSFAAPGFLERTFEIQELASDGPWRIELEPCPTIQGRVLDPAGRPLTNLNIYAEDIEHEEYGWACVDTDGRFCVPLERVGTYELEFRGGDHKLPEPLLVTSGTSGLILRPQVLPSIRGCVRGPDGRGLPKAGVTAWDEDVARSELRRTLTDEVGYFRFDGLDGVTWRVTAEWLPGGLRAPQLREVRVGTEGVVLTAMRTLTIEGRILGIREGVPGTYGVEAESLEYRESGRLITLQPDGSFRIEGLLPGLHAVSGWSRTSRTQRESSDTLRVHAGSENVLIVLRPDDEGARR